MYQIGQKIVYGACGVCRVAEEKEESGKAYLVLEPEGQVNSRYYVPVNHPTAMKKLHPMLTREEMEKLFSFARNNNAAWIADENQRKQLYRELITGSDRQRLVGTMCTLYRYKASRAAEGKKCHVCDNLFLKDAERLLAGEISAVLEMSLEQAKNYLRSQLSRENDKEGHRV